MCHVSLYVCIYLSFKTSEKNQYFVLFRSFCVYLFLKNRVCFDFFTAELISPSAAMQKMCYSTKE